MNDNVLEKKTYTIEQLQSFSETKFFQLQDLIETNITSQLVTLFINHTVVIKDVVDVGFLCTESNEGKTFIHGFIDIYDRIKNERLYNKNSGTNGKQIMKNDNIADILIRSNIVINVLKLNVLNFVLDETGEQALHNKYVIEIYTDWHTQLHHKDQQFFEYLFA